MSGLYTWLFVRACACAWSRGVVANTPFGRYWHWHRQAIWFAEAVAQRVPGPLCMSCCDEALYGDCGPCRLKRVGRMATVRVGRMASVRQVMADVHLTGPKLLAAHKRQQAVWPVGRLTGST